MFLPPLHLKEFPSQVIIRGDVSKCLVPGVEGTRAGVDGGISPASRDSKTRGVHM